MRKVAALVRDAKRGETESRRGNAGHASRVAVAVEVIARAIEYLAGLVAGLFPKKETSLALKIVEKCFVSAFGLPGTGSEESCWQQSTSTRSREGLQHLAACQGIR
jgi:hypothetical protein